jgi:hypothetical protein
MNEDRTKTTDKSKTKRKLITAIIIIVAVICLLLLASVVIDKLENKKRAEESVIDYDFYPADFEENIYDDEKYLSLIEGDFLKYCDSTTNLTVSIDRESAKDHGDAVVFIVDVLYDIINGDHEAYSKNFSNEFYKHNHPKEAFTMQKIYDVTITYISTEKVDDYTKYNFCLEYRIYENNGTFRKDIGDGSKKQYLTMTDRSGELLIDSISTAKVVQNKRSS